MGTDGDTENLHGHYRNIGKDIGTAVTSRSAARRQAELVAKHRVLIYSGSVDACVPTWGSERWTRDLGLNVERAWHPWKSASASVGASAQAIAGYAIRYEHNFTFATVKGAGHEVPRFKPAFALTLFRKFINGEPL